MIIGLSKPEFIKKMGIVRNKEQGQLEVIIETSKNQRVVLSGHDDFSESLNDLLSAERILISKELDSGREYGTIRVECWVDGCYSEYWCDGSQ